MKRVSKFFLVVVLLIAITSLAAISAATSVKVQAFNGNLTATTNSIAVNFLLVNTGTDAITLSNVKMRYYFTSDGTLIDNFACDWCSASGMTVTGTFVNITPVTNADRYVEVGFTGTGTLAAGANVIAQCRMWRSNWTNFTQTNDYSFNSSATNFVDSPAITAYINGTLNWGTAPGGTAATPTPTVRPSTPTPTFRPATATPTQRINTPTPTRTGAVSAFSQIEAESYNTQSGVQTESCGEGGQNIGYIENGDYVVYNNIDFGGGATGFQARVASATSGGNIEIRLDGTTGALVGTCTVAGTGGWQTWTTRTCSVSGASGTHNLYLRFTGGSGYLMNLNWLKFTAGTVTPTVTTTPTPTVRRVNSPTSTATPTPTRANTPTPTQVQTAGPVGWAAVNALGQNGTTGGAGGPTIHVYSKAELEAAAYKDDNPAIIVVHGNLTGGPAMDTNVKSNKTIIGDGSGAYLNFGLYLRGSNIIIKNLDIMNGGYNPGDSEGLDSVTFAQDLHHVWVDHCTMHETMDGTVDPTRNCRFVTISYCKFHTQNTACLIGGSDTDDAARAAQSNSDKRLWHYTVTVHHNYWTGINSRCPRVRFGAVHCYNNYYENLDSYAIGRGDCSNIYSENNYFYNTSDAFYAYDDSSNPGYVNDIGSLFEGTNGNTTDNPPSGTYAWTPGQYYSYTAHAASWVKSNLKNYCGIGKGNP